MSFRVIIAGSRGFNDYELLCRKCDIFFSRKKPTEILCGEARGADLLGKKYALERGVRVLYFPANWDRDGKSAGYLRNREMAENADALVAFWDGTSKGTAHMINLAKEKKLMVRVVRY